MREYTLPDGNVAIAFSGGRTSACMLHQILEANGDLPERVVVSFQNTGREMPKKRKSGWKLSRPGRRQGNRETRLRGPEVSDYRGRMMSVRGKSASMMAGDVSKYAEGHRDARRACAEIASGADKEIERLESAARLFDLHAEALAEIKATIDGDSDQPVKDIVYGLLAEIDAITKEGQT